VTTQKRVDKHALLNIELLVFRVPTLALILMICYALLDPAYTIDIEPRRRSILDGSLLQNDEVRYSKLSPLRQTSLEAAQCEKQSSLLLTLSSEH
jgi:hypothetical protein